MPTDVINGVKYSYRLIHDALPSAGVGTGGANTVPTLTDVEEFTTDVSGNAWTAVSGIMDSFYGNTALSGRIHRRCSISGCITMRKTPWVASTSRAMR